MGMSSRGKGRSPVLYSIHLMPLMRVLCTVQSDRRNTWLYQQHLLTSLFSLPFGAERLHCYCMQ